MEINYDGRVAGAVVHGEQIGVGQTVRGMSFEGTGQLVAPEGLEAACDIYAGRWPKVRETVTPDKFNEPDGPGLFEIGLRIVVLFDELNFSDDPRQEINWKEVI
jgi:hypothetical protein